MTPAQEVDYILNDCFLAVGQAVGTEKSLDFDAIQWWRTRYRAFFLHAMTANGNAWLRDRHRAFFLHAMTANGNAWLRDRHRVTAVGRFLGQRALHHAGSGPAIDLHSAALASKDVETGCRMNAEREGVGCTDSTVQAF